MQVVRCLGLTLPSLVHDAAASTYAGDRAGVPGADDEDDSEVISDPQAVIARGTTYQCQCEPEHESRDGLKLVDRPSSARSDGSDASDPRASLSPRDDSGVPVPMSCTSPSATDSASACKLLPVPVLLVVARPTLSVPVPVPVAISVPVTARVALTPSRTQSAAGLFMSSLRRLSGMLWTGAPAGVTVDERRARAAALPVWV